MPSFTVIREMHMKMMCLSRKLTKKERKKGLIISSAVKGKGDQISSCTLRKEII